MKKQVLGILAALFVFAALLSLGAYAAADNVYAILYNDGTFVFQYGDIPESGKSVTKKYEVDLNAVYHGFTSYAPWNSERESVRVVSFADKISPTSTAYWFYGCENLERVDNIHNLDTANVTDMRAMFFGCSGLTLLDLSYFNTANVTYMGSMFCDCSGLTALDLSCFNTANVTYMGWMFSGCNNLMALDLSSFNTSKVKNMNTMFNGCSKLKTIHISDKFITIFASESYNMFTDCIALVGGNGTKFDSSHTDKAYARIDTASAPGYFTAKTPDNPAPGSYAITAVRPYNGNLFVTLTKPDAVTLAVSYFDAHGQFVSVNKQDVPADIATVTSAVPANAKTARVMLFDTVWRPLCGAFEAGL